MSHIMDVADWVWQSWQIRAGKKNPASAIREALAKLTNDLDKQQDPIAKSLEAAISQSRNKLTSSLDREKPIAKSLGAAVYQQHGDIGKMILITRPDVCSRCGVYQSIGTPMLIREKRLFCEECLKEEGWHARHAKYVLEHPSWDL